MVYGLVSLVARTCCIFCYLKSVEISPGFSVSCYHSREIRVYVYIQFNPVLYVWEELFCYGCLRTIFPFFLQFLCVYTCVYTYIYIYIAITNNGHSMLFILHLGFLCVDCLQLCCGKRPWKMVES